MASVVLPAALRDVAGRDGRIEIDARNVRELFRRLREAYPALAELTEAGLAVSIDGEIVPDPMLEELRPDSEVHFLPQIGGG
ncbi:MAG: MoaD/ThiS family protein [Myxococcales bacterium]|nr:MoaD/ThiS family protein [Myxococcales bacterium]